MNPLGICPIYGPRKIFGPEDSGYRETSRRRDNTRVWRGRSADLGQSGDYQLSVGEEMRSEWHDLQIQVRNFQKKSDLEKSKSHEGG